MVTNSTAVLPIAEEEPTHPGTLHTDLVAEKKPEVRGDRMGIKIKTQNKSLAN